MAADGGAVLIAGGTSGTTAQSAILRFDPAPGAVRQIGRLPSPLTHAAGVALGGTFYVLGGRGGTLTSQRSEILAVDPRTGAVRRAGRLRKALSDLGAVASQGRILVAGGRDRAGVVQSAVWALTPR